MAQIPSTLNGVTIEFAASVVNDVDQRLIDGLARCIDPQIASGHALSRVYVSSAFDSHRLPSRHMQHKAVDISRINGTKIAIGYPRDDTIKAIVDAIQDAFETYAHKRENFGPHLKKKLSRNWVVAGHGDHIHLSVN